MDRYFLCVISVTSVVGVFRFDVGLGVRMKIAHMVFDKSCQFRGGNFGLKTNYRDSLGSYIPET